MAPTPTPQRKANRTTSPEGGAVADAGSFNESTDCIHYESTGKIRRLALPLSLAHTGARPYPPLPPKP